MPSKGVEDYIHRIGRAGRKTKTGYNKGASFTFFTRKDARSANELIDILKESKQPVPPELEQMAGGGGYRGGGGRGGGGYRGGGGGRHSSGDNGAPLGPRRY